MNLFTLTLTEAEVRAVKSVLRLRIGSSLPLSLDHAEIESALRAALYKLDTAEP